MAQALPQALPLPAEMQALRLEAQLAARLVRPIGHFDPSACDLPPLSPAALAALSAHPAFREPLNRAVSRELGLGAAAIDAGCLDRLKTSPRSRLAALLVSQPAAALREAALRLAAAILHRRVVGLVLKSDRERVRAALGEAGFVIATKEAPLLHAPLAEIAGAEAGTALAAQDPGAVRERLVELGLKALARFCAAVEPALAALFAHRLAPAAADDGAPLGEAHLDHVTRLLRRRMDAWSPIIA